MGIFNHHIESANFKYNKTLDVVVSKASYVLVTSSTGRLVLQLFLFPQFPSPPEMFSDGPKHTAHSTCAEHTPKYTANHTPESTPPYYFSIWAPLKNTNPHIYIYIIYLYIYNISIYIYIHIFQFYILFTTSHDFRH